MTIIALSENTQTLSMSAFDREGKLVAGNFVVKLEPMTFVQLLETIGSYVGQYISDDAKPGVAVQAERSSLINFLTKELANAGVPILAVPGESHADMAQNVVDYMEQQRKEQEAAAAAQQEAANSEPGEPVITEDVQLVDEVKPENKPKRNKQRRRNRNKQSK